MSRLALAEVIYNSVLSSLSCGIQVGYGDVTPVTPVGRLIASLAALSGILVLAIPITGEVSRDSVTFVHAVKTLNSHSSTTPQLSAQTSMPNMPL